MRKGFTLIELLGVIVILGVISVLIVPTVNNMLLESREKLSKAQETSILKAAKNWGNANMFLLPDCDGESTCDDTITITLGQLMNDGFLDSTTIKDALNDKTYSEATEIVIGKKNGQNTYKLDENKYADEIENPEGGPSIIFSGSSTIILEASRDGEAFTEPGVIVTDKAGNTIDYSVTVNGVEKSKDSLGISTKTVNNYKIVYTATANGKTSKNIRNVSVKDTTAPTISFVSNIEVDKDYAKLYTGKCSEKWPGSSASGLPNNSTSCNNVSNQGSSNCPAYCYIKVISPSKSSTEANAERSNYLKQISSVVVMDNTDSNPTIKIDSAVKTEVGTYAIKYTATDKYKNSYSKTRIVKIIK